MERGVGSAKVVNSVRKEVVNEVSTYIKDRLSRLALSSKMGLTYQGTRKVYQALGYPDETDLTFAYYYNLYDREGYANAIIDKPVDKVWNNFIHVTDDASNTESAFKKKWEELEEAMKITPKLIQADKLMGIGNYSVLLFGMGDISDQTSWAKSASGKLVYIKALAQIDATIKTTVKQTSDPRYGLPETYEVKLTSPVEGENAVSLIVHHSRVLHLAHGGLGDELMGRPRLKAIVNRLLDLQKLSGGSAEMFWRGARPGYHAKTQEGYELSDDLKEALDEQFLLFENDMRRILTTEGVDLDDLAAQVTSPDKHVDIQLQEISAQTGIPKRILTGSERGELASSQDETQWKEYLKTRMEDFAEPIIIKPLVKKLQELGALPKVDTFEVIWQDVFAPSEDEKAKVGKTRAEALAAYGNSQGAQDIMPIEAFLEYGLGLEGEQIKQVMDMINDHIIEEDRIMREVEAEIARRQMTQPPNGAPQPEETETQPNNVR